MVHLITPIYFPSIGGIETYVHLLLQKLGDNDPIRVSVFEEKCFKLDNMQPDAIPRNPLRLNQWFKTLNCQNTLIINDPRLTWRTVLTCLYAKKNGIKFICVSHGFIFHTTRFLRLKKLIFKTLHKIIYAMASSLVCVSESDYEMARNTLNLKNIKKIELGINFKEFENTIAKKNQIIVFGRSSKNKRIGLSVSIIGYLLKNTQTLSVVFIGQKDLEIVDQIYALKKQFGARVHLYSQLQRHDLIAKLAESKYMLSASTYEGFGLATIEALASRVIPICNDIEPTRSIIDGAGLLIPMSDPMTEKGLRSVLAFIENGRRFEESKYDKLKSRFDCDEMIYKLKKLLSEDR